MPAAAGAAPSRPAAACAARRCPDAGPRWRCAWKTRSAARGRCAPSAEGPNRCTRAGGCQPEQERCASGAACCSGVCNVGPEGVGRCAKPPRGVADHCRVVGELCMKADECCAGASCRADAAGPMRCLPGGAGCAAAGYPCVVAAQCCGGFCLPDAARRVHVPRHLRARRARRARRPKTAAADRAWEPPAPPSAPPPASRRRESAVRQRGRTRAAQARAPAARGPCARRSPAARTPARRPSSRSRRELTFSSPSATEEEMDPQ